MSAVVAMNYIFPHYILFIQAAWLSLTEERALPDRDWILHNHFVSGYCAYKSRLGISRSRSRANYRHRWHARQLTRGSARLRTSRQDARWYNCTLTLNRPCSSLFCFFFFDRCFFLSFDSVRCGFKQCPVDAAWTTCHPRLYTTRLNVFVSSRSALIVLFLLRSHASEACSHAVSPPFQPPCASPSVWASISSLYRYIFFLFDLLSIFSIFDFSRSPHLSLCFRLVHFSTRRILWGNATSVRLLDFRVAQQLPGGALCSIRHASRCTSPIYGVWPVCVCVYRT